MMKLKKPFTTTDEFYKAVENLISALRANGNESDANILDQLLHGVWTTGSELIGELMLSLENMTAELPNEVQKLRDDCHYFAKHHRRILGLD